MLRYIFKMLVCILLIMECKDIPRDNILDPQNPNSYRSSTVLIEAFVNTANPLNYNQWALLALDSIKKNYEERVLIAEYHRDAVGYPDPHSINSGILEPLYEKYVANSKSNVKGIPDIFINGITSRVQGASSVKSVFTRLNFALSDLVILDIGMPGVDGFGVLQYIRQRSDIPVILVTARDEPSYQRRALAAGADGYMTKPFDRVELVDSIRAKLNNTPSRRRQHSMK